MPPFRLVTLARLVGLIGLLSLSACRDDLTNAGVADAADTDLAETDARLDLGLDLNIEDDAELKVDMALDVHPDVFPYDAEVDDSNVPSGCGVSTLKMQPNQCAAAHALQPGWQTGDLNSVPADLGISLAWSYENACPVPNVGTFWGTRINGDTITAIGDSVVVSLGLNDGEASGCITVYAEAFLFGVDGLTNLFVVSTSESPLSGSTTALQWGVFAPTDFSVTLKSLPGCSFNPGDVRVAPDGQILVRTTSPPGIVSIDPLTTDVNWVVDDADIKAFLPSPYDFSLLFKNMGFDASTRELIIEAVPGGKVGIDSCGDIRVRDGVAATIFPLGQNHLEIKHRKVSFVAADGRTEEKSCMAAVSLSEDVFACVNQGLNNDFLMTLYQPDLAPVDRVVTGPAQPVVTSMVASREGVLVLPSSRGIEFYDWRDNRFVGYFAKPFASPSLMRVHDIASNGKIFVSLDDQLVALQTNLTGVAPGRFPKPFSGPNLGYLPPW